MNEQETQTLPNQFWIFYRMNFYLHLMFLLMALAVIVCSFVMTSEGRTAIRIPGLSIPMPQTCLSRRMWGMDCPGCGLTRSFVSMSHAEFSRAFSFNAAGPLVYLFVLVQIPWHLFQICRLWNLKRPIESGWLYVPLFAINAALLIQWLWRMVQGDLS